MEQTLERKDIQETPFSAIHYVEKDVWKISLANQIIVDKEFKTYEDAEIYVMGVNELPWDLIFNATSMFTTYVLQQQAGQAGQAGQGDINNTNTNN